MKLDSGITVQNVWTSKFFKCKSTQQSLKLINAIAIWRSAVAATLFSHCRVCTSCFCKVKTFSKVKRASRPHWCSPKKHKIGHDKSGHTMPVGCLFRCWGSNVWGTRSCVNALISVNAVMDHVFIDSCLKNP